MNIRDYHPTDYSGIIEICKHIWDGHDYLPQMIDKYFADPNSISRVVDDKGKIVGVANTRLITKDVAWLEAIRTHPDERGKGIATRLTRDQIANSKTLGAKYSWLLTSSTNEATRKMCENLCFVEDHVFYLWGYRRDLPEYTNNTLLKDTLGLDSMGQLANWQDLEHHLSPEAKDLQQKITSITSYDDVKQVTDEIKRKGSFSYLLGEYEVLPIDKAIISVIIETGHLYYIRDPPSLINIKEGKESNEELFIGITTIDPTVLEASLAFAIEKFPNRKYRLFYSNEINNELFFIPELQFRLMSLNLNL